MKNHAAQIRADLFISMFLVTRPTEKNQYSKEKKKNFFIFFSDRPNFLAKKKKKERKKERKRKVREKIKYIANQSQICNQIF